MTTPGLPLAWWATEDRADDRAAGWNGATVELLAHGLLTTRDALEQAGGVALSPAQRQRLVLLWDDVCAGLARAGLAREG